MDAHRAHIDQGGGFLKNGLPRTPRSSTARADSGIPTSSNRRRMASSISCGVASWAQTLVLMPTTSDFLKKRCQDVNRALLARQRLDGFIEHGLKDGFIHPPVRSQHLLIPDQDHPGPVLRRLRYPTSPEPRAMTIPAVPRRKSRRVTAGFLFIKDSP